MSRNAYYRLGLVASLATVLFLLFGIGALGIIGAGGPRGMALTLLATAAAQVVVGGVAIVRGLHDLPGASVVEILGLTGMYAALFAGAGWLFWRAAVARTPSVPSP